MRWRTKRSAELGGLEPSDSRKRRGSDALRRRGRLEMREGEHYNF